jgi:hypothetical protein
MAPNPPTNFEWYGPQWQWECTDCQEMGDVWDTEEERDEDAANHVCSIDIAARNRAPIWREFLEWREKKKQDEEEVH